MIKLETWDLPKQTGHTEGGVGFGRDALGLARVVGARLLTMIPGGAALGIVAIGAARDAEIEPLGPRQKKYGARSWGVQTKQPLCLRKAVGEGRGSRPSAWSAERRTAAGWRHRPGREAPWSDGMDGAAKSPDKTLDWKIRWLRGRKEEAWHRERRGNPGGE